MKEIEIGRITVTIQTKVQYEQCMGGGDPFGRWGQITENDYEEIIAKSKDVRSLVEKIEGLNKQIGPWANEYRTFSPTPVQFTVVVLVIEISGTTFKKDIDPLVGDKLGRYLHLHDNLMCGYWENIAKQVDQLVAKGGEDDILRKSGISEVMFPFGRFDWAGGDYRTLKVGKPNWKDPRRNHSSGFNEGQGFSVDKYEWPIGSALVFLRKYSKR